MSFVLPFQRYYNNKMIRSISLSGNHEKYIVNCFSLKRQCPRTGLYNQMIKDRKIESDRKQDSIPKFVLACKVAVFQADVESSVVCCTTLALYQAWSVPLLLSLPAASLCFSALYFPRCTSLYFHSSECFQIEM